MSASPRLVPAALAVALLLAAPAAAQTPAQRADELNDEGKALFADKDYEGAHARFREAATLSPEGRFYFNMCYSLNFLERYDEAIQACEQVEAAGADAALVEKTRKALASLREKAAASGPARGVRTGGTGAAPDEPTGPDPASAEGPAPSPGRAAPGPDPFVTGQAPPPSGGYQWSLGASLGVLGNIDTGRRREGEVDHYDEGGGEVRFFANFILSDRARVGLQAFLGFGALAPADPDVGDENLVLGDIGGGVFIHLPLGPRLVVTPMVGPLLSIQQPQELSQGFFAGGGRAELSIAYVFGRAGEHAISVVPAVNVYGPASGSEDGREPGDFGLDEAHSTFGVSAGYTYRFSSPFGSVPLITLE